MISHIACCAVQTLLSDPIILMPSVSFFPERRLLPSPRAAPDRPRRCGPRALIRRARHPHQEAASLGRLQPRLLATRLPPTIWRPGLPASAAGSASGRSGQVLQHDRAGRGKGQEPAAPQPKHQPRRGLRRLHGSSHQGNNPFCNLMLVREHMKHQTLIFCSRTERSHPSSPPALHPASHPTATVPTTAMAGRT